MSKTQKEAQMIDINGESYNVDDLSPEQVALVNHIQDLSRKISSSEFNLEQLRFGQQAFMSRLTESLKES